MIKLVLEYCRWTHQERVERVSVGNRPAVCLGGIVHFAQNFGHSYQRSQSKECRSIRVQIVSGVTVDQPENAIARRSQRHRVYLIDQFVVLEASPRHLSPIDNVESNAVLLPFIDGVAQELARTFRRHANVAVHAHIDQAPRAKIGRIILCLIPFADGGRATLKQQCCK